MSLMLKGIDLPSKGKTVTIDIDSEGTVWMSNKGEWEKYRAIQMPKGHGRLIDADALQKQYREVNFKSGMSERIIRFLVNSNIDLSPTILEAEE